MMDLHDEILDVSRDQRIAANLVKHIRKLRWIGLEREAQRILTATLRLLSTRPTVAEPAEADRARTNRYPD
jgi:hypothetical protein